MPDWIAKNNWLTLKEQQNNADVIWANVKSRWSLSATAAILGNMQSESNINPGIWEGLKPYEGGYGLVQWTPYTKLTEWIQATAHVDEDEALVSYNFQIARIDYEAANGLQWFSNPQAPITDPPISLSEFLTSDLPPQNLAWYFIWFYEHPANPNQPNRATQADYWYRYLSGQEPPAPDPIPGLPTTRKGLPVFYYTRLL